MFCVGCVIGINHRVHAHFYMHYGLEQFTACAHGPHVLPSLVAEYCALLWRVTLQ